MAAVRFFASPTYAFLNTIAIFILVRGGQAARSLVGQSPDQVRLLVGSATPQLTARQRSSALKIQSLLRFAAAYFALIGLILIGLLLELLLVPPLHRHYSFRKRLL
jgi:hypothetical protein